MEIEKTREKLSLEEKIKNIDDQILSLTELKQKYLTELDQLSTPAISNNNTIMLGKNRTTL